MQKARIEQKDVRASRALRQLAAPLCLLAVTLAAKATAAPMDLSDATPRWVAVRFETSPAEQPARTDVVYGPPLAAWLEPEAEGARVRVAIPGHEVETRLVADHEPVPGTFSDFVWSFDPATGDVRSTMDGTVMRTLHWGIAHLRTQAQLHFRMDTLHVAGFRKPRRLLGQSVVDYCDPDAQRDCVRVRPRRYDPATGYVNAVGPIEVENALIGVRTFSTLGEAIFSERDGSQEDGHDSAPEVASGPDSKPPRVGLDAASAFRGR